MRACRCLTAAEVGDLGDLPCLSTWKQIPSPARLPDPRQDEVAMSATPWPSWSPIAGQARDEIEADRRKWTDAGLRWWPSSTPSSLAAHTKVSRQARAICARRAGRRHRKKTRCRLCESALRSLEVSIVNPRRHHQLHGKRAQAVAEYDAKRYSSDATIAARAAMRLRESCAHGAEDADGGTCG